MDEMAFFLICNGSTGRGYSFWLHVVNIKNKFLLTNYKSIQEQALYNK